MLIHLTKPRGRNHMLSKKIPSIKIVVQLILSIIIWNLWFRHLLICCSCCGDGCVKIKCPLITKCNAYLIDKAWKLSLKINHSYFAQVQGQMYVTGRKWCDFFVYILVTVLLLREYATMTPILQIFLKAIRTFNFFCIARVKK